MQLDKLIACRTLDRLSNLNRLSDLDRNWTLARHEHLSIIAAMVDDMKTRIALITLILITVLAIGLKTNSALANNARTARQLYSKYCVSCHGRDGRSQTSKGKYSHARDLTEGRWQDDISDERLFNSIMNGRNVRGNMPGFSDKLNTVEGESLVEFVRGLRR